MSIKRVVEDLYPKRRDIISDGFDESLAYLQKLIPLAIREIGTGTKCWTWTVPPKWSVREAYIEDSHGKKVVDMKNHGLHVLSYSLPINKTVTKEELLAHVHTKPTMPDAIPYEFKYYERDWGFCMTHDQLEQLQD